MVARPLVAATAWPQVGRVGGASHELEAKQFDGLICHIDATKHPLPCPFLPQEQEGNSLEPKLAGRYCVCLACDVRRNRIRPQTLTEPRDSKRHWLGRPVIPLSFLPGPSKTSKPAQTLKTTQETLKNQSKA